MTAILLLNAHSMANAGDAALLETAVCQIRDRFGRPRLLVASDYPREPALAALGVETVPSPAALARGTGNPAALLAAFRQADIILGCPGNPFFSMGRLGKPLLLAALQPWLALAHRKPLVVLPQSIGPFTRAWEAALIRALYRRARHVFVRDAVSLRLATLWDLPAAYAPDPSFLFAPAGPADARSALTRAGWDGRPALGVTVLPRMVRTLDPARLEGMYRALGEGLARLVSREDLTPVFFAHSRGPSARENDRLPAQRVLTAMGPAAGRALMIEEPLSPALLKACYGQMEALVASRLHAGLFALGMGAPAQFIGYLTKTRGMLESLGLAGWGIQLEETTCENLPAALDGLWQQRLSRRELLAQRLPGWVDQAHEPFDWLKEYV